VVDGFTLAGGVPRIFLRHCIVAPFRLFSVGLPTGVSSRTI
jgi:hypothetical protein